jgi:multidrug resistance efflux pump
MTGWRYKLAVSLLSNIWLLCPGGGAAIAETMAAEGLDRGIVKSVSAVTITADLNARINRAAFRKGQKFQRGDVLIEFDCRRYAADLAGAEADVQAESANFNAQTEMASHSAAGRNDVEIARAKLDKAQAAARAGGAYRAMPNPRTIQRPRQRMSARDSRRRSRMHRC